MGYLDNSSITVDAILTKKGRELLSKGRDFFVISQFALADDEVDYELWNPAHPLGSDYYGVIIENMPIVEAVTDENYSLRYKLLTLPKNTIRIPIVSTNPAVINIEEGPANVTVITCNTVNGTNTLGYTVTLLNSDAANIVGDGKGVANNTDVVGANEDRRSVSISTGTTFTLTPKILPDEQTISTKLIIVGNETGGSTEIEVTITDNPQVNTFNI
jgi:hypothetical protein|tara:strand:+ start:1005 stop:1652 length:648 start_codon:yes stop_codon:yes gene_type:complete